MREQSGMVSEDILTECGSAGLVFSFPKVALDSVKGLKTDADIYFFRGPISTESYFSPLKNVRIEGSELTANVF